MINNMVRQQHDQNFQMEGICAKQSETGSIPTIVGIFILPYENITSEVYQPPSVLIHSFLF